MLSGRVLEPLAKHFQPLHVQSDMQFHWMFVVKLVASAYHIYVNFAFTLIYISYLQMFQTELCSCPCLEHS
jgi:hypothetical protein